MKIITSNQESLPLPKIQLNTGSTDFFVSNSSWIYKDGFLIYEEQEPFPDKWMNEKMIEGGEIERADPDTCRS